MKKLIRNFWWKFDDIFPFYITNKTDYIRFMLNPRQKWLIKKIPNHWSDKSGLIETLMLEMMKHFVSPEGEDCFGVINWDSCESHKKIGQEIKNNYEIITKLIPELELELESEYGKLPPFSLKELNNCTLTYEEKYGKINVLEKKIFDLKTDVMVWMVKNRDYLWT